MLSRDSNALKLVFSLFALYIIWGSTYFVIRIGVGSWPPLMMAGVRYSIAGVLLTTVLLLKGSDRPSLRQMINAGIIGILLLAVGNGLVTVAEHMHVPSGITAIIIATVPLFAVCFGCFWGLRATKLEWFGIVLGLLGIILLNTGGNLISNPIGALLIVVASISWAFGSIWSSRLNLPKGMMAGAVEMTVAGCVLLVASRLNGEKLDHLPDSAGLLAVGYLIVFGSIIAISAYMYLLTHARPALATSYAYVNPVVAVLLGMGFGGEHLNPVEWLALGVIVLAVVIVIVGKSFAAGARRHQA
ncbi:drug/metabolite exporter YedA [Acerihabitans sp. TG2]|uniref:drug/metabolite exporter YedA n=1 Tax=Acerihabitans sp. TG2 TaxID=3096008 RepID=UPI002B23EDE0|nr:drug/metabolite exporter YedA [Acerihabitans sp. TG2]MEA9391392.1 drug/metabolite exporter YedA [Acerihabitans sp. TG2]